MFYNKNYDCLVTISDDSDSVSSSCYSTDDEDKTKKFILGNNILNSNPLEIISVRQINDIKDDITNSITNVCYESQGVHFDECVSDLEDEEVFSEESIDTNNSRDELYTCTSQMDYELPKIGRFQSAFSKEFHNVGKSELSNIGEYCLQERSRRMLNKKENITSVIKTTSGFDIPSNVTSTEFISQTPTIKFEIIKQDIVSKDDLSNLSIDVLTEFINSDKPLKEIVRKSKKQSTIINKKRKRSNKKEIKHVNSNKILSVESRLNNLENNAVEQSDFVINSDTNHEDYTEITNINVNCEQSIINVERGLDSESKTVSLFSLDSLDKTDIELLKVNDQSLLSNCIEFNSNKNMISLNKIDDLEICEQSLMEYNSETKDYNPSITLSISKIHEYDKLSNFSVMNNVLDCTPNINVPKLNSEVQIQKSSHVEIVKDSFTEESIELKVLTSSMSNVVDHEVHSVNYSLKAENKLPLKSRLISQNVGNASYSKPIETSINIRSSQNKSYRNRQQYDFPKPNNSKINNRFVSTDSRVFINSNSRTFNSQSKPSIIVSSPTISLYVDRKSNKSDISNQSSVSVDSIVFSDNNLRTSVNLLSNIDPQMEFSKHLESDSDVIKLNTTALPENTNHTIFSSFTAMSRYNFLGDDMLFPTQTVSDNFPVKHENMAKNLETTSTFNDLTKDGKESSTSSVDSGFHESIDSKTTENVDIRHDNEIVVNDCCIISDISTDNNPCQILSPDSNDMTKATCNYRDQCVTNSFPSLKNNSFKRNYYSPDASIQSREEMSEFLHFQWLMFCEMYTVHNLIGLSVIFV